jgi:peptidoglycan/LPS O-acetylase OafA/YrhL
VATVAVVLLHAGVPYAVTPLPGLPWPVHHPQPSGIVEAIFWSIEGCVMPVFFWLSGFGAAQSLSQRGPREFWQKRLLRIGKPLLVFGAILLPLEFYIWLTGWALDGEIAWRKLRSLKLDAAHNGIWGLSHLWYLEFLLIYSAALVTWDRIVGWAVPTNSDAPSIKLVGATGLVGKAHTTWRSRFRLPALAIPATLLLWWSPEVVVGFQHGFLPDPAKLVFSGLFFAAGVLTYRCGVPRIGSGYAAMACGGMVLWLAFPLIQQQAAEDQSGTERFVLAMALGGYGALISGGLWDRCMSQCGECRPAVRMISGASYWTYLVHHPLVAMLHIVLRPTGWPALLQFAVTTAVTLAICWVSYDKWIRGSAVAALLGEITASAPQRVVQKRAA